jgi:RNA polymerase sigma factor (sigma-70 family)
MRPISRLTLRLQSDSRLVELAAGGREPAFEAIFDRYCSPLLRYCGRLLPVDRAEDVVQQTFENAFAALRSGDQPRRLRPWLYRIAHNLSVNTLQKNGWDYDQLDPNYDGVPQPPEILDQREQLARLVNQMQKLPDRQRSALVMHVLEGHSYEEIARDLEATPPVVRQLLHRARTRLRDTVGLLVPLPLIRALLASGAPGTDHLATAAAGAGSGTGIAKVGVSLFAAAALAGGAGVAVKERVDHHPRPDSRPIVTQPRQQPTVSQPAQKPVRDHETRSASKSAAETASQLQVADRNEGPHTAGVQERETGRNQDRAADEENSGRHGRPEDRDEEGTEARHPSTEDGEHSGSDERSGAESGSSESGGSRDGEGEKRDSAPSTPDEPSSP